ncbi:tRNA dimethylallyltransferase [Microbacteriaceae bacterium SG_E_30_P1]|uniref:tRNA dimethylallyltransferase n=1 Tax=Antiquaquibacter oligotrophicus TaxID=2880260 RepID=A0ABT6KNH8_9MICO|nr:tRNA (adenosine(37)-N6)-dimethylallyltransferase MiaA [Antiquaquibacter oligotrophicus]MDH6180692.1 tRNA dimethylallyltransferase [Antiquaquibacter oligotrophicus]UDF13582.1 tRNA (adenosine(37)-N6)-dimethylallyltransferase MiaA [Antiquaquibacter oligotrophicus]
MGQRLIVIVGATGTGKSALSLDLAERVGDAEIVNADAMQLYRGMDIGTAKVPMGERRGIRHHLLDVLDPSEEASVARYQREARRAVEEIEARGAVPILVGGSGLYVSSVIQDFEFPGTDPDIRARIENELRDRGPGLLFERLALLDPAAAASIGPHNGRRIVRALEVIEMTGEPFGAGLPENRPPWRDAVIFFLQSPRDELVTRLDSRASGMFESGLTEEVRRLRPGGLGVTASRAIGYAQALAHLDGAATIDEAIAETAALTRRYARRQVGWFKRYPNAVALRSGSPTLVSDADRHIRQD